MNHAEKELERLKEAYDKWLDQKGDSYGYTNGIADFFWPFVAYALNDLQGSAQKTAMLNRLKAELGFELMAHEKVGLNDGLDEKSAIEDLIRGKTKAFLRRVGPNSVASSQGLNDEEFTLLLLLKLLEKK